MTCFKVSESIFPCNTCYRNIIMTACSAVNVLEKREFDLNTESLSCVKSETSVEINDNDMTSNNLRYVFNLGNSIIGVGVLAMPYCFSQCGVLLAIILLITCNLMTRITCYLLIKSAHLTRRKSYESLAFHTFGPMGKLMVEISIIGFLLGCLIAFFVVMGDLGPEVVSRLLNVEKTSGLRTILLTFLAVFVVLPCSLLRKLDSLTTLSIMSILFYFIFLIKIILESLPNFWHGIWRIHVVFWNAGGLLTCLPIFSMALACQTQIFEICNSIPDPTLKRMNSIVAGAVNMCTCVYILVGLFGYVTFCTVEVKGNLLTMFPSSLVTEAIRLGFVLSVAVSFPLVIFPCRASIHSLLCKQSASGGVFDAMVNPIPDNQFTVITLCIVAGTWIIGILIPNIELVLGLNGSTVGTVICIILPAIIFIKVVTKSTNEKLLSQVVFSIGVFVLVASTYSTLQNADKAVAVPKPKIEINLSTAKTVVLDRITTIKTIESRIDKGSDILKNGSENNSHKEPPVPDPPKEKITVKTVEGVKQDDEINVEEKKEKIDQLKNLEEQHDAIVQKRKQILKDLNAENENEEHLEKKQVNVEKIIERNSPDETKVKGNKNEKSRTIERRNVVPDKPKVESPNVVRNTVEASKKNIVKTQEQVESLGNKERPNKRDDLRQRVSDKNKFRLDAQKRVVDGNEQRRSVHSRDDGDVKDVQPSIPVKDLKGNTGDKKVTVHDQSVKEQSDKRSVTSDDLKRDIRDAEHRENKSKPDEIKQTVKINIKQGRDLLEEKIKKQNTLTVNMSVVNEPRTVLETAEKDVNLNVVKNEMKKLHKFTNDDEI